MSFQSDSPGAEERAFARIRTAAEQTLAAWPEARAAVLFGSRARGDHSETSDWDIAFIVSDGKQVVRIPDGLPIGRIRDEDLDVQCVALPEPLARRKTCAIGHVARGIVRDGRLLAGIWRRPGSRGEPPAMQSEEYRKLLNNAIERMQDTAMQAEDLGKAERDWDNNSIACDRFTAGSANAAGFLAKAMLGRHGIDYPHTHDLAQLGNLARRAGQDGLADAILSMNGLTKEHHVLPYEGATADDCRHAVGRFLAMMPLLEAEIAAAASRLSGKDAGRLRKNATNRARECKLALREAVASNTVFEEPPEAFFKEMIAVVADARPALANALAVLEERLDPGAGPPPPSPFDD